jgi:hypothetical protein
VTNAVTVVLLEAVLEGVLDPVWLMVWVTVCVGTEGVEVTEGVWVIAAVPDPETV